MKKLLVQLPLLLLLGQSAAPLTGSSPDPTPQGGLVLALPQTPWEGALLDGFSASQPPSTPAWANRQAPFRVQPKRTWAGVQKVSLLRPKRPPQKRLWARKTPPPQRKGAT